MSTENTSGTATIVGGGQSPSTVQHISTAADDAAGFEAFGQALGAGLAGEQGERAPAAGAPDGAPAPMTFDELKEDMIRWTRENASRYIKAKQSGTDFEFAKQYKEAQDYAYGITQDVPSFLKDGPREQTDGSLPIDPSEMSLDDRSAIESSLKAKGSHPEDAATIARFVGAMGFDGATGAVIGDLMGKHFQQAAADGVSIALADGELHDFAQAAARACGGEQEFLALVNEAEAALATMPSPDRKYANAAKWAEAKMANTTLAFDVRLLRQVVLAAQLRGAR